MQMNADKAGVVHPAVMAGLRQCLASHHAVNLDRILQHAGTAREQVIKALEGLVALREVEVLCPVSAGGGRGKPTFHPLEHYRLIRPSDHDHAWQVRLTERPIEGCRAVEREWQAASRMPERISDFGWLLPWRQYACSAG